MPPRHRIRPADPDQRRDNEARLHGNPGRGGRARIGGTGGGGGLIVPPSGPGVGPGTQIHHITLGAVASQTIAAGGATVQWGTVAGAPTEVRGFAKALEQLADNGSIGAIPIDVTGDLELSLHGKWGDYPDGFKCSGDLVLTRTREGATATKTVTITPAARHFRVPEIAWDVRAGDTITVTMPNGSGSDQTLAEAELQLRVIAVASPTTPAILPGGALFWFRPEELSGANGDPVSTWSDYSGNGNDVSNTGTARPTLVTGELNGQTVVRFDGSDDRLTRELGSAQDPTLTVFAVVRHATGTAAAAGNEFFDTERPDLTRDITLNALAGDYQAAGASSGAVIATLDTAWHLLVVTFTADEVTARFDRSESSLGDLGVAGGWTALGIGGDARTGTEVWNGDIAEVAGFARVLTAREVATLENYALGKFGV